MATSTPYQHAGITELSLQEEDLATLLSSIPGKVTIVSEGVCKIYTHKLWTLFYNTTIGHGWLNHLLFTPWSVLEWEKRLEREKKNETSKKTRSSSNLPL